ncbi:unnamed protein product [Alternaria alternata]
MASKPQVILVVGGTSGIGYAITQCILSSPYLPLNAKVIAFGLIDSTIKLEFTKQQRERLRIVEGDVTVEEDREIWDEMGDEMVEPPELCGDAIAKLALGLFEGGKSGETLYYYEHIPRKIAGT